MKLIVAAIILSTICVAKVWASALTAPIDGYGITIPEWEVEVFPGGPTIKLNGTVEEVHSELLRINPDWDTDYPPKITKESPSLNKRAFDVSGYFCRGRWGLCTAYRIEEGAQYLYRVRGLPSRGPGPGNCERVSCSYNSAIYWCNDAREGKTLQGGYSDIADGAVFLVNLCSSGPSIKLVSGQVFSTSDWNVIVRADSC